ncbi:MAG TPA: adenylate/guanylate cyclase domain-containing protein, partial [bacterium]|nr:adenylate/guanylate cyclase domain-containing protein [bacterium]
MKCPSCAFENPPNFRFCGGCGGALGTATATPPPQTTATRTPARTPVNAPVPTAAEAHRGDERRTVTILFCDIHGFTAMSEKLDPEVVQEIMDRAFERLTAVINGFGGTIDKYIGDAIMALFGAPVALGDDPERAVRAGLQMQRVMTEYGQELQRTRGFPLAMRVGINTGKVIWGRVGGAGDKTFTVMGDAVNLASRLEHAAPIGGVLIGEATARHVRDRFAIEALEPIQIKGKAEPQRTYLVRGENSGTISRRTVQGPRSPFVGRDEEMAALSSALRAARSGKGAVITLEAGPGAGKSRMVLEFRGEIDEQGLNSLSARAAAFGQGAPFAPWSDLIQRAAGIGALNPAAARQRIAAWMEETAAGSGADPRWLHELAGVADLSDPEVQRRREQPAAFRQQLHAAVTAWLSALAAKRGTVLVAEDLHWWPAPALELLVAVSKVARSAGLLLLATRRPEPVAVEWPPEKSDAVITLHPLDGSALHALAHGVLGADVPRALVERLDAMAGGNPFFAEELIQAFIDKGALRTSNDRSGWVWDEAKAESADLPSTVEGVTQARIDALPPREKRTLQMAAAAGRSFWEGLLVAMGEPEANEALLQLTGRDLVHVRRSRLSGEREYAFKHATIQSVAYENSLKRDRVNEHRIIAEWLEARMKDSAEFAPVIAEHYVRAEEPVRALPYLLRAAEDAVRAFAQVEEATVVERAVQVAETAGDEGALATALRLRGRLRRIAGKAEAESDLRRAMEIATKRSDSAAAAAAGRDLAGFMIQRGRVDEAEEVAEKTLLAARTAGIGRIEAAALNQLATISGRR